MMMRSFRTAALAALLALPAAGSSAGVMVELFTSQGCSSCPPADRVLGDLAGQPGVIALSFHVDYWDYLGWQDTFASPQHTARQIAYRDHWNERVIYTPQAVIQGQTSVPATSRSKIEKAVAAVAGHDAKIWIDDSGGMLKARLEPMTMARPCTIWIAKFSVQQRVEIARGENAGKAITYHNVVTGLDRIGDWSGQDGETVMLPQPEPGEGIAVWLQDGRGGPILAAAAHTPL